MRKILAILTVFGVMPASLCGGPLLDAIDRARYDGMGPLSRAIAIAAEAEANNLDVFTVTNSAGERVTIRLEQPTFASTAEMPVIDLSSGRMKSPDVGCKESICPMCVINALAEHGQAYDYVKTLSHTERMRLHYRLHDDPDFAGVEGKVQRVGQSGGRTRGWRLFNRDGKLFNRGGRQ